MAPMSEWVLLAYRLPREPSTPRIRVWRKLRRLGVVQLVDGLVALPASAKNREQFDWLADEILEAGGEAWTWSATPGSKEQQRTLAARLHDAAAEEYRALLEEADAVLAAGNRDRRTVERLRRELRRIEARDHFAAKDRVRAARAVERLGAALETEDAPR
ncbi:MAG TPA: Chromate resistance protein ChrB [Acidimicrobiia bacterium]|nr:Chromate resistance protein ChrB [Acidimicrobiia bacterium]